MDPQRNPRQFPSATQGDERFHSSSSVPPAFPSAPAGIATSDDTQFGGYAPAGAATEVYPPEGTAVVSWTASEFIAHHKSPAWYFVLGAGAFVVSLIVYLITRDVVSAGVVVIGAVLFGFMASRQPRQLQYTMYDQGLTIGPKAYPYKDFRSFSVVDEGHFSSIVFMPLKRFAPPLSIYYHPDDESKIVEVLAVHLPIQPHKRDLTESLMRQIRF